MSDASEVVFTIDGHAGSMAARNAVAKKLSNKDAVRFQKLAGLYSHLHGDAVFILQANNKSVQQIFDELESELNIAPIVEGEIDGMKFQLFDSVDSGVVNPGDGEE